MKNRILSFFSVIITVTSCFSNPDELTLAIASTGDYCQGALLTVAADQKLEFGGQSPAADIETFLKTLSSPERPIDEHLALEIKTLIEKSPLFKSGLVAHFFLEEADETFSKNSKKERIEFVENFHLLSAFRKVEVSFSVMLMVADFFDEFLIDNEDAPQKLKMTEAEFLKLKNFWPQFVKGDSSLSKLHLALLVYFQYYVPEILRHVRSFNRVFSGYKKKWLPFEGFGYDVPYRFEPVRLSKLLFENNKPAFFEDDESFQNASAQFGQRKGHPGADIVLNFIVSHTLKVLPIVYLQELRSNYQAELDPPVLTKLNARIAELNAHLEKIVPFASQVDEATRALKIQSEKTSAASKAANSKVKLLKESEAELLKIQKQLDDLNPRSAAESVKVSGVEWLTIERNLLKYGRDMEFGKFMSGIFSMISGQDINKKEDPLNWSANLVLRTRAVVRLRILDVDSKNAILDRLKAKINFYVDEKRQEEFYKKYFDPNDWGASSEQASIPQVSEIEKGLREKMTELKASAERLTPEIEAFAAILDREQKEEARLKSLLDEAARKRDEAISLLKSQ